jgi:nitrogen fixation-related uncharacterized protein
MTFLTVWIGYTIIGVTLFSAAFAWAVRTRQFSDLGRARYIALRSAEPVEPAETRAPSRIDRYTWLFLFLLLAAVLAATLWIGRVHHGTC